MPQWMSWYLLFRLLLIPCSGLVSEEGTLYLKKEICLLNLSNCDNHDAVMRACFHLSKFNQTNDANSLQKKLTFNECYNYLLKAF